MAEIASLHLRFCLDGVQAASEAVDATRTSLAASLTGPDTGHAGHAARSYSEARRLHLAAQEQLWEIAQEQLWEMQQDWEMQQEAPGKDASSVLDRLLRQTEAEGRLEGTATDVRAALDAWHGGPTPPALFARQSSGVDITMTEAR